MKIIERDNGNDIKIYASTVDATTLNQVKKLGNHEAYLDSKIRIMPDCHAGIGCTIGTTMTITDKITPNLVGVDIGCGMLTTMLRETEIDLEKIDSIINKHVPSGFNIHTKPQESSEFFCFDKLIAKDLNIDRAKLSLGSLGGGNHFIEIGQNSEDELFLIIHSGSRNIGNQIAKYYQNIAIDNLTDNSEECKELIEQLKLEGRHSEISTELKKLKKPEIDKELAYLTDVDFKNYLHDMKLMQKYASLNRMIIANIILSHANLTKIDSFETIHNYIDFEQMILRKGAVSAKKNETLLIPLNMRDGSLLAKGKGNPDWNYSAPHGAGRLMGRNQAFKTLNFDVFKSQMEGIYSSSVLPQTLDESPDAYKSINEIVKTTEDTIDIIDVIKPIYNFKAH